MPKFYVFDTCKPYKLRIKVSSLVLCGVALVRFPDDGHLRIETCGNIHCGTVIKMSKGHSYNKSQRDALFLKFILV